MTRATREPGPDGPATQLPAPVLIVDDDRACAETLAAGLRRWQISVVCAHDGAEALEVIHALAPPAVLLDIGLPDMSGLEVARAVHDDGLDSCLILMSGLDERLLAARESGVPVFRMLHKPVPIRFLAPFMAGCVTRVRSARIQQRHAEAWGASAD